VVLRSRAMDRKLMVFAVRVRFLDADDHQSSETKKFLKKPSNWRQQVLQGMK